MRKISYSTYGFHSQKIGPLPKEGSFSYNGWGKGVNIFANANEIKDDEFAEGINIMITGLGSIRMPRFGSELFYSLTGRKKCNGGIIFRDEETGVETPLIMFDGRLYKYVSGNLTQINSDFTWNADARIGGCLYHNYFYFGNGIDDFSRANLDSIVKFTEVADPTTISVTKTGTGSDYIYQYAITKVTNYGETGYKVSEQYYGPKTLNTSNYFTISTTRATETGVIGYNVYRSINGSNLFFIQFIPQAESGNPSLQDTGLEASSIYVAPEYNTTGGVKGKYFASFKETLFVTGVKDLGSYLFYTGTGVNFESFSPDGNGGWVKVNSGDGTKITSIKGFDIYLLIIKENSVYRFDFADNGAPQIFIVEPLYGSPYPNSIEKFEKDLIMISSDNRIRTLGYMPTLFNVIKTNDISTRVQPVFDNEFDFSSPDDIVAVYFQKKYIVCDGEIAVCYDKQYEGFHGEKWTNYNYALFLIWHKEGREYLLGIKNDGTINRLLEKGVNTDNGGNIYSTFRPKTIDGKVDIIPKFFRFYKLNIKSPRGSFLLETWKDGITVPETTSISIQGGTGISAFMWGEAKWGQARPVEETETFETLGVNTIITKEIYDEAYHISPRIVLNGNEDNNLTLQTISGYFDYEDLDYFKEENILRIDT